MKKAIAGHKSSGVYYKYENNWDCIYRVMMAFGIACDELQDDTKIVQIKLSHINTTVQANVYEIKENKKVLTFNNERRYYYPIEKWEVIDGDKNWIENLPRWLKEQYKKKKIKDEDDWW